jgi:hypothetical protein
VAWEDWELGGELGLAVAQGGKSGRILSPGLMGTATRIIDDKFLELGLGFMFGSDTEINYNTEDVEFSDQAVKDDAGKEVKVKMSVIPMTINFHYTFYRNFYVGAGAGLYHVFYKKEPLGKWRVNPDSEPGEPVKWPTTTALGFQQIVGVEVFPLSENWNWFMGIKTFMTTSAGHAGGLLGITIGGKVRYTW